MVKKKRTNYNLYYIPLALFLLILITVLSGFNMQKFLKSITGGVTSGPTNVSVTVGTINVFDISAIAAQSVTEDSTTNVTFSYLVDIDAGAGSLLNNTAFAVFNVSGYSTSRTTTCGRQTDFNSTRANYSCSILVWYFEPAGNWSVYTNITDNSGNSAQRLEQWNLSETTAILFAPQSLTWPTITASSRNQTSNNDPTTINNTANANISQVRVQAISIHGLTTTAQFIPVANFTVYNNTGSSNPECNDANIATKLANNTVTNIAGIGIYRGNHSAVAAGVGGSGQQVLYYCIFDVPSSALVSAQTYSTNNSGSWTVSVV